MIVYISAATILLIGLSLLIYARFIEPKMVKQKKVDLKISNNYQFKDTKILFFSDLHLGKLLKKKEILKIFSKIDLSKIEIVIFGGDLFGEKFIEHYSKSDIREIFSIFDRVPNRLAVLGNHETKFSKKKMTLSESLEYIKATGFRLLRNETIILEKNKQKMAICGLDENHRLMPDIVKALEATPKYDMLLVVMHQPDYFDNILSFEPNLVLSGHSHGGQINFFSKRIFIAEGSSKYYNGIYENGKSSLIVTTGIGNNLLKMRLFSPPNLYIIRLI